MAAKLRQELEYLLQETGRDEASLLAEAVQEGIHTLFRRCVRDAYIEGKDSRRNNLVNSCGAGLWPALHNAGEDACTTI